MSQTIEQAQAALVAANAAYDDEMKRDSERRDGSSVSEGRREDTQRRMLDTIARCERDLEESKRR
jgi:hypothetical protein